MAGLTAPGDSSVAASRHCDDSRPQSFNPRTIPPLAQCNPRPGRVSFAAILSSALKDMSKGHIPS
jgi:hypothetical protein